MHEAISTHFDVERNNSVFAVRVKQQQRVIESAAPERIRAPSVCVDVLRADYQLEQHRARLVSQLSESGDASVP